MELKKCIACSEEKQTSMYNKNAGTADGLHPRCKECQSLYNRNYYKECADRKKHDDDIRKIWNDIRRSSGYRKNKRSFDVPLDWFRNFWAETDKCFYCGITEHGMVEVKNKVRDYDGDNKIINKYKRFPLSRIGRLTVDRMDNNRGYEIGNLCKACYFCNSIKSNMLTADEMKLFAEDIMIELLINIDEVKRGN